MDDELRALLQKKRAAAASAAKPPAPVARARAPAPAAPAPAASGSAPAPARAAARAAARDGGHRAEEPRPPAQPTPPGAATPGDALVPFRLQHRKTSSDELRTLLGGRPVVQLKEMVRLVRGGWPGDVAVVGVVAAKTAPKRSRSGNEYVQWTLDDLDGHGVTVLLFGSACQGARNVEAGMVCLLTDPRLMEDRNNGGGGGGNNKSAAQSLSVSQPYQILQAGFSADFALCSAPLGYGGGACNRAYSRAGGQRFCQLHRGGGGGGGGGGAVAAGSGGGALAAAAQQRRPALPQRGPTLVSVGNGRAGGGGGLIVRPAGMAGKPAAGAGVKGGGGKPGQSKLQSIKSQIPKDCLSYKAGWKDPSKAAEKKPAGVQAATIVARVTEGGEVRSVGLARAEAEDNPRRDGEVVVPGQSKLFDKGADGVAYATYKHRQHVAREERMQQRYRLEDQRSAQARSQAAKALINPGGAGGSGASGSRKAMRGTISLAPGVVMAPPAAAGAGRAAGGTAGSKGGGRGGPVPPAPAATASMTAEEADRLMKTQSRHSAEASMELMEHLDSVFESLAEKENRMEHAKTVASVDVTAYQCQKCGRVSEKWPKLCSEQGHRVQKIQTKKRFFVCANPSCGGQATLVGPGMHPKEACPKCGERSWRVRGKGKALNGGDDCGKGNGLARPVAAIADWNRYDGGVDALFA